MTSGKYTSIGKLGKPHGIGGAFRFLLYRELKSKKKLPPHFLLESKGSTTPFFIKSMELKAWNEGFIKFEDITTPEAARLYAGREIFLPEGGVDAYFKPDADELNYLMGYKVFEEEKGEIGTIAEVIESPGQLIISVVNGEQEWMIPLADDFITKTDKRKKEIHLSLPEGLLDL